MGGVAVLQSQHSLKSHYRNNHAAMRSQSGSTVAKSSKSSNPRKRSPPSTPTPLKEKNTATTSLEKNTSKPCSVLVMGQVKILKRGEVLPSWMLSASKVGDNVKEVKKEKKAQNIGVTTAASLDDLVVLSSTNRLGPESDVVPKHIRISDFYAGSAFISSPPASSLPVPVFFRKKDVLVEDDCRNTNYNATSDLRRLLRLDLS